MALTGPRGRWPSSIRRPGGGLAGLIHSWNSVLTISPLGYSQAIRQSTDNVKYPEHEGKVGTPRWVGWRLSSAISVGYMGTHLAVWSRPPRSGLLALYLIGLGLRGDRRRLPQDLQAEIDRHPSPNKTAGPGLRRASPSPCCRCSFPTSAG